MVIFSAYSLHTGISYAIPYLTNAFGVSIALGATMGIIRVYAIQMFGGPLGGFIVDKIRSSTKFLSIAFGLVLISVTGFIITPVKPNFIFLAIAIMMLITVSISAMRGVYFVPIAELQIKDHHLGLAAGSLSVIGVFAGRPSLRIFWEFFR